MTEFSTSRADRFMKVLASAAEEWNTLEAERIEEERVATEETASISNGNNSARELVPPASARSTKSNASKSSKMSSSSKTSKNSTSSRGSKVVTNDLNDEDEEEVQSSVFMGYIYCSNIYSSIKVELYITNGYTYYYRIILM